MTEGATIIGWFLFAVMVILLIAWLAYLARLRRRGQPLPQGHGFQTTMFLFIMLGNLNMALRYRPEWFSFALLAGQGLLMVYIGRYLWGKYRGFRERARQEREAWTDTAPGDTP